MATRSCKYDAHRQPRRPDVVSDLHQKRNYAMNTEFHNGAVRDEDPSTPCRICTDIKRRLPTCPYLNGTRDKQSIHMVREQKYQLLQAQRFFWRNDHGKRTNGSNQQRTHIKRAGRKMEEKINMNPIPLYFILKARRTPTTLPKQPLRHTPSTIPHARRG